MTPYEQRLRVAAVIRNERRDLLCVRHFNRGRPFWTLPGGELEATETPEAAILREVAEETGWRIHLDGILGIAALRTNRWDRPKVELFFRALPLARDAGEPHSADVVESRFFTLAELPASFRPREALTLLEVASTVPYLDLTMEEQIGEP